MAVELKVPSVGESITEVVIGEWHKKIGDKVEADEIVVVIETDKATMELPAPEAGTLTEIRKNEGDEAAVGDVIGLLDTGEGAGGGEEKPAPADEPADEAEDDGADQKDPDQDEGGEKDAQEASEARVTPAARRVLGEAGIEASQVEGTGPGGRILKEDVQRYLKEQEDGSEGVADAEEATDSATTAPPSEDEDSKGKAASPPDAPRSVAATPAASSVPSAAPSGMLSAVVAGSREEEVVRMTTLRKRIAERLVSAQQTAALLTTFNEIDMSQVMALRKRHQEAFVARHGIKVGFMSFFVKAVIEALKAVPSVNGEIREGKIVYKNFYDIGIAVGGGKGLVVPVIRNAERLSFAGVEKAIAELAGRAKANKLTPDELQGGTFTITNGGIYGSMMSTPILNPPQSGILGMHAIKDRPVVVDGEIVIRPIMYVALTYDHRLVDGREAVTFLVKVKEAVEDPARMLIEA